MFLPLAQAAPSINAHRSRNFLHAARSADSGSTFTLRATLTKVKRTSPNSSSIARASPSTHACLNSAISSSTFSQTASTLSHSNPTETALREILLACISAGKLTGMLSSKPSGSVMACCSVSFCTTAPFCPAAFCPATFCSTTLFCPAAF